MPPVPKHCQISRERAGQEFRSLHEWLDNDPAEKVGRHDLTRVFELGEEAAALFGEQARRELLMHLLDDLKAKVGHAMTAGKEMEAVYEALAQLGVK